MPTQKSETGDADLMKDEAARHSSIPRRRGLKGWLDGVRATRTGALTLKVVIGVIGTVMVVGGLIMVPFPGPGWLVVFGGLAVLATEFHWAHRLLEFGKRMLHAWTEWYKRRGWTVRIIVAFVTLCAMGLIIYLSLLTFGVDVIQVARQFVLS
ncbi:TIGR02611 family protein [Nonomuraea harbinensis]|uniref:TIGR02611 family protein n=1 Tax=Nonomuraea harbinensis TaxID=1286938 RepID=A0ABW1BU87_9ACTN|nr:TIGR02611 family protein [Nonomuraea harbinensis]